MTGTRRLLRLAGWTFLAAILFVRFTGSGSLGSSTAHVSNGSDHTGTATLAFSHAYQATNCSLGAAASVSVSCPGSIAPTAATPPTGTVSATDAITSTGTLPASKITEQVSAPSCAPAELANQSDSANVILPRYGTTFSASSGPMTGAGYITLDGSTGYASAVVQQTQPNPFLALGNTYGLGIWFRSSSTAGGPLFDIATSPVNTAGGDDRVLYLNANGTLTFIQNTSGASSAKTTTTPTTKSYADGSWHFAYVTMSAVTVLSTTTIYVDGASVGSGGGTLVGYVADNGYWHAGWAPTTVTGLTTAYLNGSLSNFVVFDTANAPADPSVAQRASQTAFNAWAAGGTSPSPTEQWELNDPGTTTFAGPYPGLTASPCSMVNLTWGFTNPTSCAASPPSTTAACTTSSSLTAFCTGTWQTISAPAPSATQTSTITVGRGTTYNTYISGLHLYAPLTWRAQTSGAAWSLTFTWAGATAAFVA